MTSDDAYTKGVDGVVDAVADAADEDDGLKGNIFKASANAILLVER